MGRAAEFFYIRLDWKKLKQRDSFVYLCGAICGFTCITSAYICGLETMAITEKQHEKLQVCENNLVRRNAGVKRIDKRRMEELKEEVGVREGLTTKLVRSRLKWAGHVERMERVRLTNRAEANGMEGRRRRGRPRLGWEDCFKRYLVGVGG